MKQKPGIDKHKSQEKIKTFYLQKNWVCCSKRVWFGVRQQDDIYQKYYSQSRHELAPRLSQAKT
jgi:hypothetical protein